MSSKKESFDFEKYSKEIQEAKNIEKIFEIIETVDEIDNIDESEKGSLLVVAEKWITDHFNFNNFCEKADSIIKESQEGGIAFDAAINLIDKFSKFQERLYKYNFSNGLTHENKDMKSLIEQIQAITELSIKAKDRLLEFAKEGKNDVSQSDNKVSFKTAEDYANEEKEKNKKDLKARIEELIEKISKEPNQFKRNMYKQQVDRLCKKIDNEIAISIIKGKYVEKIGDLDSRKEEALNDKIQKTLDNTASIDFSEASIAENKKYDYDSAYFMFDRNDVIKKGGLDNFIEYLENSGKTDFIRAANKIRKVEIEKNNLQGYYNAEEENKSRNIEREHKKAVKEAKREENRLIKKEKGNIFSRIRNFFKSIGQGIKNYFDEKKEAKEVAKAQVSNFYEQRAQKDYEDIKAKYRVNIDSWEVANQSGKGQDNREQGDEEQEQ